jgi:dynein light intermediate chain
VSSRADETEKREAERRVSEERKHQEEIQFLKRTNQQLKVRRHDLTRPALTPLQNQLESILAPSKK